MLHIVYGGVGAGKSTFLMEKLRTDLCGGKTVRTLVPEQFAFTYDKNLYDALGVSDFNRCRTGSFRSLTAEILSEIAAAPRDAADDVIKTVVLHRVLQNLSKSHGLRYYGTQADQPAFFSELQNQLSELMQSGSTPEALIDAAGRIQGSLPEKIFDIARIYADYLDELERMGMRDTLCDTVTAAAAADGSRLFCGQTVYLDEFESFTGDQYIMLEVILRDCTDVWIAMRTDDPNAPDYSRFDAANLTCRRLGRLASELGAACEMHPLTELRRFHDASLSHLSRHILTADLPPYPGPAAVKICEARDMTLEVEYTAAMIRKLLMEHKAVCRDITVVTHDLSSYGALLEAAFSRYEIPCFMDLHRSVLHTAVMKLPLCLLALAHRTTTEQLLLFLKTQLSPLPPEDAARLENYAFTWDIEHEQWETPFLSETDADGEAETLRNTVMQPILDFRRQCGGGNSPVPGSKLCRALYGCIDALGIPLRVGGLASRMKDNGDVTGGRALRKLWNRFTEILDALHDALGETPLTPIQLSSLLTTVLRQNRIALPPQMLDAVTVQSAAAARFDAPRIVFILGVNEGTFPADIASGGFFSEQERSMLAEAGIALSRSVRDLCADERLIVCKTISAASERLFLSYPLTSESGKHLQPSAILQQVHRLLPALETDFADRMGTAFYVSTKAAAYYSFVQDYAMSARERETVRAMLAQFPEDAARLERLRNTTDPSRLYVRDKQLMRRLIGTELRVSSTQIENTMQCPFKGFCENGLRLYIRRKNNINPLSAGNLVHACMEQLFLRYPTREAFLALSGNELRAHAEECAASFLKNELGGAQGKPLRFLQSYRRLTNRMVGLLTHTQAEMAQSEFSPDACELVIGRLGDTVGTAPYRLTLPNGMELTLNGKVDRVDLCEQDGKHYLRIVDYKTGVKQFHLADIYYGLNLQMLLYLFAILDGAEQYADMQPAGVLYMPSGAPDGNRPRNDTQSVAEYVNRYFRMSGTVLCDRGILSAMEKDIAGIYIPAQLAPEDTGEGAPVLTKDSQVFDIRQLARLRAYIEQTIIDCMVQYTEGDVAPNPMKKRGSSDQYYENACQYCQYRGLCGIDPESPQCSRSPMTEKESLAAIQAILNGEEAENA